MDARKIPRNLRIHICISEIYRAPAASALKYGRFIWFSSYVGHKFPLNLEFRSRAHQPTLSPRHSPPPRPSLGPGPDISNGCKTKSRRPYLYPLPLFLSSPLLSSPTPHRSILARRRRRRRLSSSVYIRLLTSWFTIPFHPFEINVAPPPPFYNVNEPLYLNVSATFDRAGWERRCEGENPYLLARPWSMDR